jgi:hypothetical protein
MLSIEEDAPVVSVPSASTPVVSVPLVAPDNWLIEPKPAPPRFLSQDEEAEESGDKIEGSATADRWGEPDLLVKPAYFSASAPPASAVEVAPPPTEEAAAPQELELVAASAGPKLAELTEENAHRPLPEDSASDFIGTARASAAQDEYRSQPVATLSSEANEDEQRDLDKPAFLRRLQF